MGSVDLVVEFYTSDRQEFDEPGYLAVGVEPYPSLDPIGQELSIDRSLALPDGSYLVEFTSLQAQVYWIQYSDEVGQWKTAVPEVVGNGTQLQWIDSGPPKTDRFPGTATSRFYRVMIPAP
jgi:hypothetical protein